MSDFSTGARVRVAGGAGLSGGGATVPQVDTAIAAALAALTIPAALNDLNNVSGTPATDDLLTFDGSGWVPAARDPITITFGIPFIIDGGGATITTGIKGDLSIPFACTVTGWTALGDQSGSIGISIWKDTYANFPPTVADSIVASAEPGFASATKGASTTLTGWTTSVAAGDVLRFNVTSVTSVQRVTLTLTATRTV